MRSGVFREQLIGNVKSAITGSLLCCAMLVSAAAQAGIIFNNFGPGDTYNTSGGSSITPGASPGFAFTPLANANLGSVAVAISETQFATSDEIDLFLMTSVSGAPGTVIEQFHFSNQAGPFGALNPPLTASSTLNPLLLAGTQYWLVAAGSDAGAQHAWMSNNIGDMGPSAFETSGPPPNGPWTTNPSVVRGAFRLVDTEGTGGTVPEPGSLALLGLALVGLLVQRSLKRR